ncbi:ABC transporter permease [Sedimenticola thiotaurini]|uniref:ABC transporter permease n=1 Tax=Sedimenticola thiotaurini TaxID=1543721 RepID=A0A0F7K4Q5_9GAMM|nr:ABC transporter permease subunit [Sedimenticola thiotaurini]AKH22185.1 ABC transporter permease [Sedimenticola thiotaurini]
MIRVVAGRELRALFLSPLAWSLLGIAMLLLAWLFLVQIESFMRLQPKLVAGASELGVTDLVIAPLFDSGAMILLLLTPLLTMRLLCDEYRSGTIRLLLSAPLSSTRIVLGKYLAVMGVFGLLLLLIALLPLSLLLGSTLDMGRLASSLLGLALLLGCYGAIGLLLSSLTAQPAVAAVSTYGVLLFLWIANLSGSDQQSRLFEWLSLASHYRPFLDGLVRSGDVAYFLLLIIGSLLMTIHRLERRRHGD